LWETMLKLGVHEEAKGAQAWRKRAKEKWFSQPLIRSGRERLRGISAGLGRWDLGLKDRKRGGGGLTAKK